ncbi:hypothetical protein PanWU01x14_109420 [Parasponia andersonii]|uniref:Uncharacterized protein n=1 Tax=Parasponia andersonii TaxID=3476 RepID=A0A2P5CZP2_PARAD|nr:hypothetical protein PanWU01x14_109420 [Parasponia andersonii]
MAFPFVLYIGRISNLNFSPLAQLSASFRARRLTLSVFFSRFIPILMKIFKQCNQTVSKRQL